MQHNESLLEVIARNVAQTNENVAQMRASMATKADLTRMATKVDLFELEKKIDMNHKELSNKVENLREVVEVRQEADVMNLDNRITKAEKAIRQLQSSSPTKTA